MSKQRLHWPTERSWAVQIEMSEVSDPLKTYVHSQVVTRDMSWLDALKLVASTMTDEYGPRDPRQTVVSRVVIERHLSDKSLKSNRALSKLKQDAAMGRARLRQAEREDPL